MRYLSLLMVLLCLLVVGCSDDTETAKDGGADAAVEAGTDTFWDILPGGDLPHPDASEDSGGGAEASVPDASPAEGGGAQ